MPQLKNFLGHSLGTQMEGDNTGLEAVTSPMNSNSSSPSIPERDLAILDLGTETSSVGAQGCCREAKDTIRPWDSISEQDGGNSQISATSVVDDSSSGNRLDTVGQPLGTNSHTGSSAASTPTISVMELPFLEKMKNLHGTPLRGLMHYRLVLDVDKLIEGAKIQTPFGPLFEAIHAKEPHKTSDKQKPNAPDTTTDEIVPNRSPFVNSGAQATFQGQPSTSLPSPSQAEPEARPVGHDVPIGFPEYPRGPPNSPVSPTQYQNEFFHVRKSFLGGCGAFALQDLHWGQTILVEKLLFRADDVTLYDEIDKLTPWDRQEFERMHAHSTTPGFSRLAAIFRTNRMENMPKVAEIHKQNSMSDYFFSFKIDQSSAGVFLIAARFNHSCKPKNNVTYVFDRKRDSIVFTIERDVKAGEELTITYGGSPADLFTGWGFVCKCGACRSLTPEQVAELSSRLDWN